MNPEISRFIWSRAANRCEYCHVPDIYEPGMHLDHIIAIQHGGATVIDNLALACVHCNRHKGPNVAGVDPTTGQVTLLFHPRREQWQDHFAWDGAVLTRKTETGRVTIQVLAINAPDFRTMRAALMESGDFSWE